MKILYYTWDEMIINDAVNAFNNLGHIVVEHKAKFDRYDFDDKNISDLKKVIDNETPSFDVIFSFNYFPDVSRVAKEKGIKYISWVYDNPHLTLESETLFNDTNKVFIFDSDLVEKYGKIGIKNVFYSPLPAKISNFSNTSFKHDITFVGTLYDGEKDQFGIIGYLPDDLRGRLDGIIAAQHLVSVADVIDEPVRKIEDEIKKYVKTSLGKGYRDCEIDIFKDIMRKRVTKYDRTRALTILGTNFKTDLYCEKKHPELPVNYMGIVSNDNLPGLISESKINLNITLRSIKKGIPLRVMHILGAGGFCLTDYKEDMNGLFEDGNNLAWFYCEEEMLEKADYYLKHEKERIDIAKRGKETAIKKLSYEVLMNNILKG